MNTHFKLVLLTLLFCFAGNRYTQAQRFDYVDKLFFADSVKKIKLWTYIEGDAGFRNYPVVVQTVTGILERKGYIVEVVLKETGKAVSGQEWKHGIIAGMKRNEAFLEISTRILKDVFDASGSDIKAVTQPSGAAVMTQNRPSFSDSALTRYTSTAVTKIYVNWNNPTRNAFVPVFSREEKVESGDVVLAVKYTMGGIPSSKHPVVAPNSQGRGKNDSLYAEITVFGGYTFPSQMNVVEGVGATDPGVAKFSANGQYGLEISMGINRNIDVFLQYRFLGTTVKINTPVWEEKSPFRINLNYILAGTNYNFRISPSFSPYAGLSIGALNLVPQPEYLRDYWYFLIGIQGGVKWYVSKRLGFRLQADLLYQLHTDQAPFLFTNDLVTVPVAATSNMIQAGISAGIILRLGNQRNQTIKQQ
jgi:hypothetical protein